MHHSDFDFADDLIGHGLLQEIKPEWIREKAPHGVVLISCGDRDRHTGYLSGCSSIVPVHSIMLDGGGILLGNDVDDIDRYTILKHCKHALDRKKINFVFTLSHFPCGMAEDLGFDLRATILKTIEGKAFLKRRLGSLVNGVLPIISIDWNDLTDERNERNVKLYAVHRCNAHAIASFEKRSHHQAAHCVATRGIAATAAS